MVSGSENHEIRPVWLVGASYGRIDDQTSRFLREGIWENGYHDRYIDEVKSVLPGDRIASRQPTSSGTTCRSTIGGTRSP